jgi:hypothetical protein
MKHEGKQGGTGDGSPLFLRKMETDKPPYVFTYFRLPGTDFMILLEFWLLTGAVAGRNTRMSFTTFQY